MNIVPLFVDCLLHVYSSSFSGFPCFRRLENNYLIEHVRHVIANVNSRPSTFGARVLYFFLKEIFVITRGARKPGSNEQKPSNNENDETKKCFSS